VVKVSRTPERRNLALGVEIEHLLYALCWHLRQ
jgi:hypothetical protein